MNRKIALGIAVAVIIAVGIISIPLDVMPGLYNISSAGVEIVSGDTVDYADGLKLELEWQGYTDSMTIDCSLWDIEEGLTVEVGVFTTIEQSGAAPTLVWTFSLDDVRNDTNPYKLVLTGDTTGESFVFYIMGEEGEPEPPPPPPFAVPNITEIVVSETSPDVGDDITVKFTVETYCNYEWDFKVDGVVVESGIISTSGGDYRIDIHEFIDAQTENGTHAYSLHLSYVDDEGELVSVSDSIDVIWVEMMPADTDTTTTDTTTDTITTPTTTTEPPPDEYDAGFLFVCVGLGLVVVVAIIVKVAK